MNVHDEAVTSLLPMETASGHILASSSQDGDLVTLRLGPDFDEYIRRAKGSISRQKSPVLGRVKSPDNLGQARISWGEAASTIGIKEVKVKEHVI